MGSVLPKHPLIFYLFGGPQPSHTCLQGILGSPRCSHNRFCAGGPWLIGGEIQQGSPYYHAPVHILPPHTAASLGPRATPYISFLALVCASELCFPCPINTQEGSLPPTLPNPLLPACPASYHCRWSPGRQRASHSHPCQRTTFALTLHKEQQILPCPE